MFFRDLSASIDQTWPAICCRCLFAMVMVLVVSGCVGSGGSNIIGVVDASPSSTGLPVTTQHVFFATTRERSEDPAVFFSGERAEAMTLGEVDVMIPPGHEIGQIEKPRNGKPNPA